MTNMVIIIVNCYLLLAVFLPQLFGDELARPEQWAVGVEGGEDQATKLANDLGLVYRHKIGDLDFYLLEGRWPESKRVSPDWRTVKKRETFGSARHVTGVQFLEKQIPIKRVKRSFNTATLDDPFFPRAWYMMGGGKGGFDMGVRQVWDSGYSGRNVTITILDDGIERLHGDIAPNYDPQASFDLNDQDDDPTPRYDSGESNRHGTRCAGLVAAAANNSICTVGVAFKARIGGVRMLDGIITDAVEASALSLNPQHIDIYSASWGPDDDGKTVEGPGKLALKAFEHGVRNGRGGKGSIFIWASGNGGNFWDSCACDGYASSIYTLSISSTSENGVKPWYLEECSSTIAATFSSGNPNLERQMVTTSLQNKCTDRFTGTSASAPFAAGLLALALEANPQLTWRDVQHIVVETARTSPLVDAQWITNGVGRNVSARYGYGLMDGFAMVELAKRWKTVPPVKTCVAHVNSNYQELTGSASLKLTATVKNDTCNSQPVVYLEHVQAIISLNYSRRGDVTIYLTSPSGTRSHLLPPRYLDVEQGEFKEWPFSSVQFWGETILGDWTLEVINTGLSKNHGAFIQWRLVLHGTATAPESSTLQRANVKSQPATIILPIPTVATSSTASTAPSSSPSPSTSSPVLITTTQKTADNTSSSQNPSYYVSLVPPDDEKHTTETTVIVVNSLSSTTSAFEATSSPITTSSTPVEVVTTTSSSLPLSSSTSPSSSTLQALPVAVNTNSETVAPYPAVLMANATTTLTWDRPSWIVESAMPVTTTQIVSSLLINETTQLPLSVLPSSVSTSPTPISKPAATDGNNYNTSTITVISNSLPPELDTSTQLSVNVSTLGANYSSLTTSPNTMKTTRHPTQPVTEGSISNASHMMTDEQRLTLSTSATAGNGIDQTPTVDSLSITSNFVTTTTSANVTATSTDADKSSTPSGPTLPTTFPITSTITEMSPFTTPDLSSSTTATSALPILENITTTGVSIFPDTTPVRNQQTTMVAAVSFSRSPDEVSDLAYSRAEKAIHHPSSPSSSSQFITSVVTPVHIIENNTTNYNTHVPTQATETAVMQRNFTTMNLSSGVYSLLPATPAITSNSYDFGKSSSSTTNSSSAISSTTEMFKVDRNTSATTSIPVPVVDSTVLIESDFQKTGRQENQTVFVSSTKSPSLTPVTAFVNLLQTMDSAASPQQKSSTVYVSTPRLLPPATTLNNETSFNFSNFDNANRTNPPVTAKPTPEDHFQVATNESGNLWSSLASKSWIVKPIDSAPVTALPTVDPLKLAERRTLPTITPLLSTPAPIVSTSASIEVTSVIISSQIPKEGITVHNDKNTAMITTNPEERQSQNAIEEMLLAAMLNEHIFKSTTELLPVPKSPRLPLLMAGAQSTTSSSSQAIQFLRYSAINYLFVFFNQNYSMFV